MKTSFTRTQLAAFGVAGVVAVAGLGAVGHATSVKHQNRLSYERQLEGNLKEGNRILTLVRDESQKNLTEKDSFAAAGASLGQAMATAPLMAQNAKQWNDVLYSYRQTYGQSQYDKWASSSTIKPLLKTDNNLRAEIQKIEDSIQAKMDAEMNALNRQFEQSMADLANFQF
jgi:hypothetical protein